MLAKNQKYIYYYSFNFTRKKIVFYNDDENKQMQRPTAAATSLSLLS